MTGFASLTKALEGMFGLTFEELPTDLRERVAEVFRFLPPWNSLSAEQRRSAADQWDWQNDPALAAENERQFSLYARINDLERNIEKIQMREPSSHLDQESQTRQIEAAKQEIAKLERELAGSGPGLLSAAKGIRGLAETDAPLVEEMLRIIATDRISDFAAAKRVVSRAAGGGSEDAKIKRLVGRLQQRRAE